MDATVVGGGAAGYFAAIRAGEAGARVTLLEATGSPLQKVRISGGGRCNVTQGMFEPARLAEHYPRGGREMRRALARFGPADTMRWFEDHGVALKTEEDGRVFPTTDLSDTIIDALTAATKAAGVVLRTHAKPEALAAVDGRWSLRLKGGETLAADRVLLATGSNPHGLRLAADTGHVIVPPVPALIGLAVRDPRIEGLAGVSVPRARATLEADGLAKPVVKEGPLLVTHQGFSAHAILRVSAWAARELAATGYRARLTLDLAPGVADDALRAAADAARAEHPRGTLGAHGFAPAIPRRWWDRLCAAAGVDPATRWAEVPRKGVNLLIEQVKRGRYEVSGKSEFREEIVTAGGVDRGEVDWDTMESRRAPGLFFAGEILDVDGLTGGFNLQNAWTTGWLAGAGLARGIPRNSAGSPDERSESGLAR